MTDVVNTLVVTLPFWLRFMAFIAGVDAYTLAKCPKRDHDNVRAIALLFIAVWIYQTAILSIVAHRTFEPDGQINPALIAGAACVATLIYLIDSYLFARGSYMGEGEGLLRRGGLDLGGNISLKVKKGLSLAIRVALSICLAMLTGLFVSLIVFANDISAEIDQRYQSQNVHLIADAQKHVGSEIQRRTELVKQMQDHVTSLQQQAATMRTSIVDPSGNGAAVQGAEQEVQQLLAEKAHRDDELASAQTSAADELAGQKGPHLSGIPGRGPARRAAEERVQAATVSDVAADQALEQARKRLDQIRANAGSSSNDQVARAQATLTPVQQELQPASAALAQQQAELAQLSGNRQQAVDREVEAAPDYTPRDQGMLAQLNALRELAKDPEIATVILLIDAASFSLELAAVLAKVFAYTPLTYSAIIAKESYLEVVQIVDEMAAALNKSVPAAAEPTDEQLPPIRSAAAEPEAASPEIPEEPEPEPAPSSGNGLDHALAAAEKRPRGRPRKQALN